MASSRTILLPPHLQSAKEASRMLIKAFGGQEAAAAEFGERQQKFADYGLKNTADFLTIDKVDHLERCTEGLPSWPHITNWLCKQRGGLFVPLPVATDGDAVAQCVIELASELGDVSRVISTSLADRVIEAREAREALEQLDDLDRASARLRVTLNALADPAKGGEQ